MKKPPPQKGFEAALYLSGNGTSNFPFARSMAAKMAGYHDDDGTPSNDGGKMVIKRLIAKGVIEKIPPTPPPPGESAKPKKRDPTNFYKLAEDYIPF